MRQAFSTLAMLMTAMIMAACSHNQADLIVFGTIRTAEDSIPMAEAIAVKDGKFVYVGDKAGAESFLQEGVTQVIDHRGKGMVMPGCTDGHAHYVMQQVLANMKDGLVFSRADGKAELLRKLETAALRVAGSGRKSLSGMGWNLFTIKADQPTLAQLDAATHGVSTILFDGTGHHMLCNSESLRRCGIIDDKGNVLIKEIEGGLIEFDDTGHPTGYINERATGYLARMGGLDPDESMTDALAETALMGSQQLLLSTGYVSYMEGWSNFYHPDMFYKMANRLDNEGRLKMLLSMSYEVEPWQEDMSRQIDYLAALNEKYGTPHVRPEYLKVFMDGCVEDGTGAMSKPYKDGRMVKGYWSVNRLAGMTAECNAKGLTVHTHTMGDEAIAQTVDAYIKGADGRHRNCLVHLRNLHKEDYQRIADNHIACTAGMTWHVDGGNDAIEMSRYLDDTYIQHAYPIKSFFDAGVRVSSHSDFPANGTCPQDPFGIMEVAVSGRMPTSATGGQPPVFDAEELVSLQQVFQALTINGAWQLGLEHERGSIKVGKWADFVLADHDVFECPVAEIHTTKVVSTWFEGQKVYQAE